MNAPDRVGGAAGAPPVSGAPKTGDTREGFLFAFAAYGLWGFLPLYLKAVSHIPIIEVVAHRVLWSLPLAGLVIIISRRTADLARVLRTPKMLAQGALTAALVSVNWGIYIWAIGAGQTVEAALGYYINPLFSIALGATLLGERISRLQLVAIVLACCAVALLTWNAGGLPWVSIGLTFTWGFYALFKRTLPVGPNQGFFLEVLILMPLALGFVIWVAATGEGNFVSAGFNDTALLMFGGVATAGPLIFYANAAKRLLLSTIGIMQYIAPTGIFLIGVFVFGEPFDQVKLIAFMFIWAAMLLYSWSLWQNRAAPREK